ncbi:MAG: HD-GYP domain-containing protein [Actinomycetota bacterium]
MSLAEAHSTVSPFEPPAPTRLQQQLILLAKDLGTINKRERETSAELAAAVSELEETCAATVRMLAFVIEAKDPDVLSHLDRSCEYAKLIAARVNPMLISDRRVEYGFMLHDIGKVGIPESILGKKEPLTAEEWEVMRMHPMIGGRIVQPVRALSKAVPIIENHHERWDGLGYPRGLKGNEIPIEARIFALADAFDAMTSNRPYRDALSIDEAVAEVRRASGTQFDPEVVEEFLAIPWGSTPRQITK